MELKSLTLNGTTYDSFQNKSAVKSVNGQTPDENGNVEIPVSGGSVDLSGYATEQFVQDGFQPKGDYLPSEELPNAVNSALAQAKESGAFDGKDGASVTVASISESAEDGGSNVVTLSDGKTITIKNGNKGSNGGYYTPKVSFPGTNVLQFEFEPSVEDMPTVPSKTITIPAGKDGVGIKSVVLNSDYTLTIRYTDGTYYTSESIRGEKGEQGDPGKDGSDASVTATNIQNALGFTPANPSVLSLGIHTDGLVYLFVSGQPVGSGIAFTGGDIIGNVDSQNNILLTGNLADGTYTLKYENKDGTYTDVGTLVVSELVKYVNLFSQDGEGFANNTDFSGASNGRFVTNYIPCKDGNVLHVKGATIYKLKAHNSVDNAWGSPVYAASLGEAVSAYDDAVKVYTITKSTTGVSNIDKVQCEIRSGNTALDSVIITVNQDIVD